MTRQKTIIALIVTYIYLIICNFSFIQDLKSWHSLSLHLAALVGLIYIIKYADLNSRALGTEPSNIIDGVKYSLILIVPVGCVLLAAYLINGHYFLDPRYKISLPAAFTSAIILEPIKTIIFEEVVFRGILLALFLRITSNQWHAILYSSLSFGLWHVLSSQNFNNAHSAVSAVTGRGSVIIGTVLFTTIAGIIFCQLRLRSKSLSAPIAAHWFVNSFAIILTAYSWRNL